MSANTETTCHGPEWCGKGPAGQTACCSSACADAYLQRKAAPPIAAPVAHIERRNGQRWRLRNIQTGRVREVTLGSLLSDGVWEADDNGGIGASAWRDPRFVMTLLDGAPPEPAKPHTCLNHCGSLHCDCSKCGHDPALYRPAQEAPKAAPATVCMKCNPGFGAGLCSGHYANFAAWQRAQAGKPYAGPERLPRPQLAADWVEDCLPESGR